MLAPNTIVRQANEATVRESDVLFVSNSVNRDVQMDEWIVSSGPMYEAAASNTCSSRACVSRSFRFQPAQEGHALQESLLHPRRARYTCWHWIVMITYSLPRTHSLTHS